MPPPLVFLIYSAGEQAGELRNFYLGEGILEKKVLCGLKFSQVKNLLSLI